MSEQGDDTERAAMVLRITAKVCLTAAEDQFLETLDLAKSAENRRRTTRLFASIILGRLDRDAVDLWEAPDLAEE